MAAKEERREALSIPEAREGRGSEHGALGCAARSCTSGIDRRSRTEPRVRPETNVERGNQPKAAGVICYLFRGERLSNYSQTQTTELIIVIAALKGRRCGQEQAR